MQARRLYSECSINADAVVAHVDQVEERQGELTCLQRALLMARTLDDANRATAVRLATGRESVPISSGLVYFAQAGDGGPIKIGHSRDPLRRIPELQKSVVGVVALLCVMPGTRHHERLVQGVFRKHHIRGEWFHPHAELTEFAQIAREEFGA